MCELHFYRCPCSKVWTAFKKLASCGNNYPRARCPDSLCMLVGNARRPQSRECNTCRDLREMMESLHDD